MGPDETGRRPAEEPVGGLESVVEFLPDGWVGKGDDGEQDGEDAIGDRKSGNGGLEDGDIQQVPVVCWGNEDEPSCG